MGNKQDTNVTPREGWGLWRKYSKIRGSRRLDGDGGHFFRRGSQGKVVMAFYQDSQVKPSIASQILMFLSLCFYIGSHCFPSCHRFRPRFSLIAVIIRFFYLFVSSLAVLALYTFCNSEVFLKIHVQITMGPGERWSAASTPLLEAQTSKNLVPSAPRSSQLLVIPAKHPCL